MIKQKKSKNFIYILITLVVGALLLVAFSDVPVEQTQIKVSISVKAQ